MPISGAYENVSSSAKCQWCGWPLGSGITCLRCDNQKPRATVKKTSGYWTCPKCGDGYKFKGAAKKCCKRRKGCS